MSDRLIIPDISNNYSTSQEMGRLFANSSEDFTLSFRPHFATLQPEESGFNWTNYSFGDGTKVSRFFESDGFEQDGSVERENFEEKIVAYEPDPENYVELCFTQRATPTDIIETTSDYGVSSSSTGLWVIRAATLEIWRRHPRVATDLLNARLDSIFGGWSVARVYNGAEMDGDEEPELDIELIKRRDNYELDEEEIASLNRTLGFFYKIVTDIVENEIN